MIPKLRCHLLLHIGSCSARWCPQSGWSVEQVCHARRIQMSGCATQGSPPFKTDCTACPPSEWPPWKKSVNCKGLTGILGLRIKQSHPHSNIQMHYLQETARKAKYGWLTALRAVPLVVAHSLDTSWCINGKCDYGTFIGAERELQEALQ